MENKLRMSDLGNFGFLKDFGKDYLFDLAQLAEGNLYVNTRLCSVYLRLLMEGFFDQVLSDLNIRVNNNGSSNSNLTISQKMYAIIKFSNGYEAFKSRKFMKTIFPDINEKSGRFPCPLGAGDDFDLQRQCLIDKNTIYVWNLIRHIGNAAAHSELKSNNNQWLQDKYIKIAVKEICNRMYIYFQNLNHRPCNENDSHFNDDKQAYATRQILYNLHEDLPIVHPKNGNLPEYSELLCVSNVFQPSKYRNLLEVYRNRYYLVRRFTVEPNEDITTYLLHGQKAYLIIQQCGHSEGLAPFNVLADLRSAVKRRIPLQQKQSGTDVPYYVASYEFDDKPEKLNKDVLLRMGIYDNRTVLLDFLLQLATVFLNMELAQVYHRCLTHESIRICFQGSNRFQAKIIDLELCKIFYEEDLGTVCVQANQTTVEFKKLSGNLKQYNGREWLNNTPEIDYKKEVVRRLGCIFANILCPDHLEEGKDYEHAANRNEILNYTNRSRLHFEEEFLNNLLDLFADMAINQNIGINEVCKRLEKMSDET